MRSRQQFGLSDNLTRWVHRHGSMATLFRSAQPRSSFSSSLRNPSFPVEVSAITTTTPDAFSQEEFVETQPVRPAAGRPAQRKEQATASPEPVSIPTTPGDQPLNAASSKITQDPETKDQDWQRLQAIFHKHQASAEADTSGMPMTALQVNKPSVEPKDPDMQHTAGQPIQMYEQPQKSSAISRPPEPQARATDIAVAKATTPELLDRFTENEANENMQRQQEKPGQREQSVPRPPEQTVEAKPASLPQPPLTQSISDPIQIAGSRRDERPNLIQRAWQSVGSIFRKGEQPGQVKHEDAQETRHPFLAPTEPDKVKPSLHEAYPSLDKETSLPAITTPEPKGPSMPVQRPTTNVLSTNAAQRAKSVEAKSNDHEASESVLTSSLDKQQQSVTTARMAGSNHPSTSRELLTTTMFSGSPPQEPVDVEHPDIGPTVMNKVQASLASLPAIQRAVDPEASATQLSVDASEGTFVESHEYPTTQPMPLQQVPLESIWHVQRLAADQEGESDTNEREKPNQMSKQASDVAYTGLYESQEQPVKDDDLPATFKSSGTSIEVLPPSRPRPAQTSVMFSRSPVQQQAKNHEPSLVNTAIGPLPSDLWSLLGQAPPASSSQPETNHHSPAMTATPGTGKGIHPQHTLPSLERPSAADPIPASIQRQAVPDTSSTTAVDQQAADPDDKEGPKAAEADLEDLTRKVYAEVRRRLARESERAHRYL